MDEILPRTSPKSHGVLNSNEMSASAPQRFLMVLSFILYKVALSFEIVKSYDTVLGCCLFPNIFSGKCFCFSFLAVNSGHQLSRSLSDTVTKVAIWRFR